MKTRVGVAGTAPLRVTECWKDKKKMILPQISSFTQTKIHLHHYDISSLYISGNVHVFDIIIILLLVVQAVELDIYSTCFLVLSLLNLSHSV